MSEHPIPPDVIEAAACALYETQRPGLERANPHSYFQRWSELRSFATYERARSEAETVIRAADEMRGLRVDDDDGHNECYRLISDWMPKPGRHDV